MANTIDTNFNPSDRMEVDIIKQSANDLYWIIDAHVPAGELKDRALMDLLSAQMFAVRALFPV